MIYILHQWLFNILCYFNLVWKKNQQEKKNTAAKKKAEKESSTKDYEATTSSANKEKTNDDDECMIVDAEKEVIKIDHQLGRRYRGEGGDWVSDCDDNRL